MYKTYLCLLITAGIYDHYKIYDVRLLQTQRQIRAAILVPALFFIFVFSWNSLKSLRPEKYKLWSDYMNGFIWHFLKPSTRTGVELVSNMKDLIRGTIYSDFDNMINAYKFFKETPDIKIIGIKEKIQLLSNVTVNFIYKN